MIRNPVFALLALICVIAAAPRAPAAPSEIRDARTGAPLAGPAALAERARDADLIVFGEIHDNPAHQAAQARLARDLNIGAVAFEMVPRAAEAALARLRADPNPDEAARTAARWDRYKPYHVVIEAVPDAAIIGAGLSRDAIRAAIRTGPAAVFAGDPARWDLDQPLPADLQSEMQAEQMAAHCDALPESMLPGMVSAQRLRDASFAQALLRARDALGPGGGPAMLVTGNGHARKDRGVPAYLARAAPKLKILSIGQIERRPEDADWRDALARWTPEGGATDAGAALFDIVIVTDPAPREDPCAKFLRDRKG